MTSNASQTAGITDPRGLHECLKTIDGTILELVAIRTKLMNEVQDAFTGLRSSAQLFREIFFGVELPIESPKTLIERAGGSNRLIRVTYKETGPKVFALADVVAAIPHFRTVFPIRSFETVAKQLEKIRENDPNAEATWFANQIPTGHLRAGLEQEAKALGSIKGGLSIRAPAQPVVTACGCCGATHPPSSLVATAFADMTCGTAAVRWTGRPVPKPRSHQPTKTQLASARRSTHGAR